MAKSTYSKAITRVAEPVMRECGFSLKRQGAFWRLRGSLMHLICLERAYDHFTCEVAVQPLYIPFHGIHFAFGDRIGSFGPDVQEWYPISENAEEMAATLELVLKNVRQYGLPWLDQFTDSDRLLQWFLNRPRGFGVVLGAYGVLLALVACHAGRHQKAEAILLEWLTENATNPYASPKYTQIGEDMLRLIREAPERIPERLMEYEAYTRAALKLPPAGA